MNFNFQNKKILVTGTSQGIGKSIVEEFLKYDAKVCGISRKLVTFNKNYYHIKQDVNKLDSVNLIIKKLKKINFWPIDIVVHNVGGTLGITDPFCSIKDWRKIFRLNFEFAVELNNKIVSPMVKKKWGRIIHVSSISGMENQGPVTYCSAKAALTAYSRSMGGVLAPKGIVVSCILPGAVYSEGNYWDNKIKSDPKHVKKYLKERQRIGRFGNVKEISDFIIFLSSSNASFNTGSIIPIDGGQGRSYFGQ